MQKAEGRKQQLSESLSAAPHFLPSASCLLPSAFCLLPASLRPTWRAAAQLAALWRGAGSWAGVERLAKSFEECRYRSEIERADSARCGFQRRAGPRSSTRAILPRQARGAFARLLPVSDALQSSLKWNDGRVPAGVFQYRRTVRGDHSEL